MSANTTRTPLTRWSRDISKATVLAYRRAKGEGLEECEAQILTQAAYLAAGGRTCRGRHVDTRNHRGCRPGSRGVVLAPAGRTAGAGGAVVEALRHLAAALQPSALAADAG